MQRKGIALPTLFLTEKPDRRDSSILRYDFEVLCRSDITGDRVFRLTYCLVSSVVVAVRSVPQGVVGTCKALNGMFNAESHLL